MAKILVVDNNPDQMRSLRGLIAYRTPHSLVTAETNMDGIRAVFEDPPDLIMINALMYMHRHFSFHKALQKNPSAAATPILVHTSSDLEDLTRRRMEVNGVAGFVGVPTSAGELNAKIDLALCPAGPPPSQGVKPVVWERVDSPKEGAAEQPREVKPVDWTAIRPVSPPIRTAKPLTPAIASTQPPRKYRPPQAPATKNGSDSSEFRPQSFKRVDPSDRTARGRADEKRPFEEMTYPKVNPDNVKNRPDK